jgi:hypothetical protein
LLGFLEVYFNSLEVRDRFKRCNSVFMEHLPENIVLDYSTINQALEHFKGNLFYCDVQTFLLNQALDDALDFIRELYYVLRHRHRVHF